MNYIKEIIYDRNKLRNLILFFIIFLFLMGLYFLFYAYIAEVIRYSRNDFISPFLVQIVAFILGIFMLFLFSKIKYQIYKKYILIISILSAGLMLLLLTPFSIERNGATRWVDLGLFQFQPSEIFKIAIIMFFAFILSRDDIRNDKKKLLAYSSVGLISIGLTAFLQPDYGTALIMIITIIAIAIVAKMSFKWLGYLIIVFFVGLVSILSFGPSYINDRFDVFYATNFGELTFEQRFGVGYHTAQNLEAVRVGGLLGQGPGYVSQSSHLRIPEVTTDSIFALVAAETGFIGSLAVILSFMFFFFLLFTVSNITKDMFAKYLIVGIATLFSIQFLINIAVVLGIPATGIPLIFFSKGGTSIIATLAALGIVLNVLNQQPQRRRIYRGSL